MHTRLHSSAVLFFALLVSAFGHNYQAFGAYPPASSIEFIKGDFEWIQRYALNERKPYFVTFLAPWSEPCRQMEAQTFTNPQLGNFVNQNFLAYQVNAGETSRGERDLASEFKVVFYPTVIVFDADGQVLHQFSGLKDAGSFQAELEKIIAPVPVTRNHATDSQEDFVKADLFKTNNQEQANNYATYTRYEQPFAETPVNQGFRIIDEGKKMEEAVETWHTATLVYEEPSWNPAPDNRPVIDAAIEIKSAPAFGFALQAGAFGSYENARTLQSMLKNKMGFATTIWTVHGTTGTPVYKVMVGNFLSKANAELWRDSQKGEMTNGWFAAELNR